VLKPAKEHLKRLVFIDELLKAGLDKIAGLDTKLANV
jgi:hypothetical protein